MRSWLLRVLPLTAILLVAVAVWPQVSQAQERRLLRRINVDADGKDLAELMGEIARATGKTIIVAAHVRESVTVRLHDISWRDAVDVIARLTHCTLQELPRGVLLITRPPRVSIQLEGASVRTALLMLASYADTSIVISPDVQGTISLHLRDVDWNKALSAVALSAGDYTVVREGNLVTIGGAGGARLTAKAAPVLVGKFVAREGDTIIVATAGNRGVRCELPADHALRKRIIEIVAGLRPGDRIVFSYEGQGDSLTLTNLVVSAR